VLQILFNYSSRVPSGRSECGPTWFGRTVTNVVWISEPNRYTDIVECATRVLLGTDCVET
jgi:hypothetical protein